MPDREWSNAEKKIARRVFDTARQAVLAGTMAEFKAKTAAAMTVDDMWSVGDELRHRRREIDELFDYRYSQLTLVFGRLILEGYLDEKQLTGIAEDKLEDIRRYVSFMRSRWPRKNKQEGPAIAGPFVVQPRPISPPAP